MKTLKKTLFLLLLFSLSCVPDNENAESGSPGIDPTLATVPVLQEMLAGGELTSEQLVQLCLDRMAAYDADGPALNAMITINDQALKVARALDAERQERGPRGPLHGIPVILKDNYDTKDLPTTGGSAILASHRPASDAYVVDRIRNAGAVFIGKANMSEFALSYGWLGYSSFVGQTKNPHNLLRDPSGSSSGSAAAVAAGYAPLGTGTDTAGSIRGPGAVCGVVGIKPTMGLVSRTGIIPAALSFDVAGPLARSVSGAAILLEIMAGPDPDDPATADAPGKPFNFQEALQRGALQDARIGVVRNFEGANPAVDSVFSASLETLAQQGATLIEIQLPDPLDNLWPVMGPVVDSEFGPQIEAYLAGLPEDQPKTVEDMIRIAESDSITNSRTPLNPARIQGFRDALATGGYDNPEYLKSVNERIPEVKRQVRTLLDDQELDALVFPTLPCPASPRHDAEDPAYQCDIDDPYRPCYLASTTGFPEISVPAGFTASDRMPVGLSFFGRPFSEALLIGLAFDFEQITQARQTPVHTPSLANADQ